MTYLELIEKAKLGKIGKLPNFTGYFEWNFGLNKLMFRNKEFYKPAEEMNILHRDDFYYIT